MARFTLFITQLKHTQENGIGINSKCYTQRPGMQKGHRDKDMGTKDTDAKELSST